MHYDRNSQFSSKYSSFHHFFALVYVVYVNPRCENRHATTVLSRGLAAKGIYPAVDPLDSTSTMLQPRIVEVFTGSPGKYVGLAETIRGFRLILSGELDGLPEQAFYLQFEEMTLNLCVLTPNRIVWDSEVKEIILSTNSGQIGVLPNHAPVATAVYGSSPYSPREKKIEKVMNSIEFPVFDRTTKNSVISTTLNDLSNWSRLSSLWPLLYGTSCCFIEFASLIGSRFDFDRYGLKSMKIELGLNKQIVVLRPITSFMLDAV
ncbi:hypothetical protein ACJIZ3_000206 [Penstemon smallii]|uniref:H(+)-transporting two-sector ATPase n=1 Tax=Penstemon smallii TaxID=265156 RepID=A0ABD3R7X6_9LAMI